MLNKISLFIILIAFKINFAHPTGDMVFTDNTLLWSYVCPIGDVQHKACIMLWDEKEGARPWLTSDHSASDWMISIGDSGNVYLVERYYNQGDGSHYSRILFSEVGGEPIEIIPWFRDEYRFGEHGFVFNDGQIIFARYPGLYKFNEDLSIEKIENWELPINSIRNTNDGRNLILSDSTIWLTDKKLNILESWENLLESEGDNTPFGGNRISDAIYSEGSLYISYWGKRRFDVINNRKREIIMSFKDPWVPHHIAAGDSKIFMLSSTIAPAVTNNIEPSLWLKEKGNFELIWGDTGTVTEVDSDLGMGEYKLFQNYSNPFNPSTKIRYSIPNRSIVTLKIFDVLGSEVMTLVNKEQSEGNYEVEFNASSYPTAYGQRLSSGIYFYRLKVYPAGGGAVDPSNEPDNTFIETKKMILLR
jgi:hypothetical protein